jgi:hypothetical protein
MLIKLLIYSLIVGGIIAILTGCNTTDHRGQSSSHRTNTTKETSKSRPVYTPGMELPITRTPGSNYAKSTTFTVR